ncbi:MAG: hypothetical protein QOE36_723 [Gaiellaceae bacterium]|nr:hypothetical protein [Gaiellaceae bacterium]
MSAEARPAFYSLRQGGWRDYVTLLHPPYTAWHLSYVAIGAALAPVWRPERMGWTLLAFFLAMGIGAHALDELRGRPLATLIPGRVLALLAALSIGGAVTIGVVTALAWTPWLLVFVATGAFLVVAYNLELFGGRLHGYAWFALDWGAFPTLTAYFAAAGRLRVEAVLAAAFATGLSAVQRTLSTPVRAMRRRVASVSGTIVYRDGSEQPLTADDLRAAPETALRILCGAVVLLAAALVVARAF